MTLRPWRGHSIGRNEKSRRPSLFCFVDTETVQRPQKDGCTYTENVLRCGVACFVEWRKGRTPKEEWWHFDTPDNFWHKLYSLLRTRRVLWLLAHNSIFDFTVLQVWNELEAGRLLPHAKQTPNGSSVPVGASVKPDWRGLLALDGLPFHLELLHDNGRVNVSDLMNYYPCSLESIGRSVKVSKGQMPGEDAANDDWLAYCKQDVQVLKAAYLGLVKQWESEDNGNWRFSAASLAWNNFRHTRNCSDIIVHSHGNARDLEWQAYYGGECRSWYRGSVPRPVVHLDVNSLYSYVMAKHEYPVELFDYILRPHRPIVESLMSRYSVIADVTMENIFDDIPARHNGRIVYPVGAFRTQLAAPEFADCLKGGCISEIHAIAYYKRAGIFGDYVSRWWNVKDNARRRGDVSGDLFAKLMLNSLMGKFAQRSKVWKADSRIECLRPWCVWPDKDPENGETIIVRSIGYTTQVARERKACSHTFPAIAATITSYARQRMRELRRHIPPLCLYYQDTDSLFIDREWFYDEGQRQLPVGHDLGSLRVVGEYGNLQIRGPKNYTADGRHCISGVRRKDRQVGVSSFIGERMERTPSIIGREPDGTVRSWETVFDTPGTCREGGYRSDGWAIPLALGLTQPLTPSKLTV